LLLLPLLLLLARHKKVPFCSFFHFNLERKLLLLLAQRKEWQAFHAPLDTESFKALKKL